MIYIVDYQYYNSIKFQHNSIRLIQNIRIKKYIDLIY
jgi:hypothetical protein